MNESGVFENKDFELEKNYSYQDFNLLKTTASSKLWRVSRDGKYFLIKTTKDNSEHQLKMLRREYELSIPFLLTAFSPTPVSTIRSKK